MIGRIFRPVFFLAHTREDSRHHSLHMPFYAVQFINKVELRKKMLSRGCHIVSLELLSVQIEDVLVAKMPLYLIALISEIKGFLPGSLKITRIRRAQGWIFVSFWIGGA